MAVSLSSVALSAVVARLRTAGCVFAEDEANVPYVPSDAVCSLPVEARLHEPLVSLDGGSDGLEVLRRVSGAASGWLAPGGHVLVEVSERQADQALKVFASDGLFSRSVEAEGWGSCVVVGSMPFGVS